MLDRWCPSLSSLWSEIVGNEVSPIIVVSALLAFPSPFVANLFAPEADEMALRVANNYGSAIDLVVHEALGKISLVEISTERGKCYIGFPIGATVTLRSEDDLSLLPVFSGYRKSKSKEMVITKNYASAYEEIHGDGGSLSDLTGEDFRIVISRTEVVSARPFDLEAFAFLSNSTPPA